MPTRRRNLSADDAKNRLADTLSQAASGDLLLITHHRKPVGIPVCGERLQRPERLEDAPPRRWRVDPPKLHSSPPGGRCPPLAGHRPVVGRADGLLVGYGGSETPSRAFRERYGVRPPIYRDLEGRLSPEVAGNARADLPPSPAT